MRDNTIAVDTSTPTTTLTGVRRGAFIGYQWLLLAFLLLGVVQIFLAGLGVFNLDGQELGAKSETAFGPHRNLGFAMGGLALIILILALIARPGARAIILSAVMFLLAFLKYKDVTAQTLLLIGGRGPAYLRDPGHLLASIIPRSRLVSMPKLDHLAPDEKASERVADELKRFISDRKPRETEVHDRGANPDVWRRPHHRDHRLAGVAARRAGSGRHRACHAATPDDGELGGVFDMLAMAPGSGGAAAALARSPTAWLGSRRADVTVTVTSPSGSVTLDARRVDDRSVLPLLREVLRDHDEH